jgi:hypothetical protein
MSYTKNLFAFYYNLKKREIYFLIILLFFSLFSKGQSTYNQEFTTIKNLPKLTITEIKQDQIGYLWLATQKDLFQFDGMNFKKYSIKNELQADKINTLSIKKDSLFIGTDNLLTIKVRNKFSHFNSKKINKIIFQNNITYIATDEGIYYFNKDYLQPIQINTKLDFAKINDISYHGNSFYIASNRGFWKIKQLIKPQKIQQLNVKNYNSLFSNDEDLIAVLNTNKIDIYTNAALQKEINIITGISAISKINNELWIASENDGIDIIDAKNYSFKRKINKYNSKLKSNTISTIFTDYQKNSWISTKENGLITYKNTLKNNQKPTVFIEDIKVNYQSLDSINPNKYNSILNLKASQSNVTFNYKTIAILSKKKIEYRWKLNNETSNWSSKDLVNFRNLKPGNYTFSIQSRIINNDQSDFKRFTFFIDIPFYKKAWFIVTATTVLSSFLLLFIFVYIRNIKRKNANKIAALELKNHLLSLEQKALQLQMNPHFIFNVLNGIKAAGNSGNTNEMNVTISKFASLLRSILNNSRKEDVSLSEEINTIKNYIELEQNMSSNSFNYQIKTLLNNIDAEEILIPSMLLQPFIENSIKHGIQSIKKDGLITIKFEVKNNFLHCSIDDNGIGLLKAKNNKKQHKSIAIKVNKERIENLSDKNSFTIKELKEHESIIGTRVWFKIPLKTDY